MYTKLHFFPRRDLSTLYSLLSTLLIGVLTLIAFPDYGYPANQINVRVCVDRDKDKLPLEVKGSYTIKAINSDLVLDKGRYFPHPPKADTPLAQKTDLPLAEEREFIVPTNSGLKLGNQEFKIYGIRIIPDKDATIFIDNRRFRGIVDILRTEKLTLLVVNHLDIEKYLYGVLYHETPHYWPMEVLKAQAVVARTFGLYRRELMQDRDYDLTCDVYSQVYGGRASERWRTTRAVDATKNQILMYNGKILPAYYHAMCGGHTEDAKTIFNIDLPSLKGRPCSYCGSSPHMAWKAKFSYSQMEERLNRYGIKVKGLNFIAEGKRNRSDRLESIRIRDSKGIREIRGFEFRLALGPNLIKSTNFDIEITPRGVIFRGKGWGHGVGMCQWGAFGMARAGFNYKQILEYYYPGAKITDMSR